MISKLKSINLLNRMFVPIVPVIKREGLSLTVDMLVFGYVIV